MTEIQTAIRGLEGITPIQQAVHTLVRQKYQQWFPQFAIQELPNASAPVRPDLALLCGGFDVDSSGQPTQQQVFQLVSQMDFAPMLHNYGFALCGIAQYALYLLNRLYRREALVEQLKSLAAYVITETASQDGKVGGPVQMAVITKEAGCVQILASELGEILKKNEARSESLKDLFYKA